jgi:hypothetical protein
MFLHFIVGLELSRRRDLFQRILFLPDAFQFIVREVTESARTSKLRRIIVPVTCNLFDLQFEVCTCPEVEGINGFFVFKLGLHGSEDLIMDLLTILIEHDLAFILRVSRVTNNIDVAVVRQFTLLLTGELLIGVNTTVPQLGIVLGHGILLIHGSQRVLNIPSTRSLEGMRIHTGPREFLAIRGGEETDNGITVTCFVHLRFPETIVSTLRGVRLLNLFNEFGSKTAERRLLLERCERHRFGLCF